MSFTYFLSVVTPTTTLLTNLPLSSTDIGFSTTTVWPWKWDVGVDVEGIDALAAIPLALIGGIGTRLLLIVVVVTYWQTIHLTEGAPLGYISVVRQFPQLTWAIWLDAGARFTMWQQEHLTLVAPREYIKSVLQPPHISWAISIPGGGTDVIVLHNAQQTFVAPLG